MVSPEFPELSRIIDLQIADVQKRLAERRIRIELADSARKLICDRSYDPHYGARPVKRFLQHELETRLGRAIIAGEIRDGSCVQVTAENGQLALKVERHDETPAPIQATADQ
ncbi:hypothetical protein [Desulfuromonas thiophila]|uniref:hypothetical protein n=1 Tax=Desulfuromonas thiophila TaxID=57664 RepID=UPI0024A8F6F2|nr:hypothetical protein [Desulfuromonas thiophila]